MFIAAASKALLFASLHELCSAERSADDRVQVSLSGSGVIQLQGDQKVRQRIREVEHVDFYMMFPEPPAQNSVGLGLAAVLLLIGVMLGFVLYKSDLCTTSRETDINTKSPTQSLWSALAASAETTVGIMKNLIGAGILCLPIAASEMSIVGAIVGMTLCCLCSLSSFLLIGFLCDRFNVSSYGDLMAAAFGNTYGREWVLSRMNVVLVVHTLGGCIAYMTIIADVSAKLAQDTFYMSDLALRGICVLFITLFLLLPLCRYDKLRSLSITSWLGVTAMMLVAGFCIRDCITDWAVAHSAKLVSSHLLTFKGNFFKAVPLINGAYIVHYNAPAFFAETEGRSLFVYSFAAVLAHIAVSFLYCAVAFAGFARFGDAVHGNVLTSFEKSGHSWVLTCWVCVLLNMLFTLPLLFQRSRQSLILIFEQHFLTSDSMLSSAQASVGIGESPSKELADSAKGISLYSKLTGVLLALVAFCGTVFRHLDSIMLVREATIGVMLMYVLPSLACFRFISEEGEYASGNDQHATPVDRSDETNVRSKTSEALEKSTTSLASQERSTCIPNAYRHYLCCILLLAGVGSSCAALATIILQSL